MRAAPSGASVGAAWPRLALVRMPWLAASLTALSFLVDARHLDWAFRRDAVLGGDYLRLVSGHFAHFNRAHVIGDVVAFAVWAALVEQRSRRLLAATVLVTTTLSSLFMLVFLSQVTEYRGLSVVDCALAAQLIALGFHGRLVDDDRLGAALFATAGAGFAAKTVYEFIAGHAILAPHLGQGVALLPASHAMGILLGLGTLWIQVGAGTLATREVWRAVTLPLP